MTAEAVDGPQARIRRRRGRAARALAVLAGVGVAFAAALGGAQSASAHDYIISTNPASGATVTDALTQVALTFNEPPLTNFPAAIAIEVKDPAGTVVSDGKVSITNAVLSTSVAPTTDGSYQVVWQTVSADGHPVSGDFTFAYAGPASGAGGGGSGATDAGTPGAGDPAGSDQAATDPADADAPTMTALAVPPESAAPADASASTAASFLPLVIGIAIGVVVLVAAVATIIVIAARRGRPPAPPSVPPTA
jgi:methionine-rich copper-binding protein CopC